MRRLIAVLTLAGFAHRLRGGAELQTPGHPRSAAVPRRRNAASGTLSRRIEVVRPVSGRGSAQADPAGAGRELQRSDCGATGGRGAGPISGHSVGDVSPIERPGRRGQAGHVDPRPRASSAASAPRPGKSTSSARFAARPKRPEPTCWHTKDNQAAVTIALVAQVATAYFQLARIRRGTAATFANR